MSFTPAEVQSMMNPSVKILGFQDGKYFLYNWLSGILLITDDGLRPVYTVKFKEVENHGEDRAIRA